MQQRDFVLVANLVSDKTGIRMIAQPHGWASNIKAGIIYYPKYTHYTDADLGFLLHEAGHLRFSDISHDLTNELKAWVSKTGKRAEQVWSLVNALEDCRIEAELKKLYAGAEYYLEAAYWESIEQVVRDARMLKYYDYKRYRERRKMGWLHFTMYWVIFYAVNPDYAEKYISAWKVDAKVTKAINAVRGSVPKLFACKNTLELMDLIEKEILSHYLPLCEDDLKPEEKEKMKEELEKALKELLKDLKKHIEEQKKKLEEERKKQEEKKQQEQERKEQEEQQRKEQQERGEKDEGKGSQGKGADGSEKKPDENGTEQDPNGKKKPSEQGEPEEGGEGQGEREKPRQEPSDASGEGSEGEGNKPKPEKGEGAESDSADLPGLGGGGRQPEQGDSMQDPDATPMERGGFGVPTGEETEEIQAGSFDEDGAWTPGGNKDIKSDPLSELAGIFVPPKKSTLSLDDLQEMLRLHLAKVRKAVSILKDISNERYEGNYESGRLENRKLFKLLTGKTRIFSRKIADGESDKDMVIAVLVDESGSMRGQGDSRTSEGRPKCEEACISATVLAKALEMSNKPFGVFGFNMYDYVHKDFKERLKLDKMIDIVRNSEGSGAGYNNDGWAIHHTTQLLLKQPQKKKILIVLSDGEPAPFGDKYGYDLKSEAKKAEQHVKVYSIGINSTAVREYYKRAVIVSDVSKLGEEMMKIFRENVGKRTR